MELEITWGRVTRVWWAFLWRSLIASIIAMIIGGIFGGIVGYTIAATGGAITTINIIIMSIGGIIGLGVSIIPMKMILGKDFGEFRLALVPKSQDT
jgi:ABC-type glycerol-3-phosphate transport system permease component